MSYTPTLKELSLKTGLSIATVSRALSGSSLVKPQTKRLIEKALYELKSKDENPSNMIGLIIPDMNNQFFPLMYEGISSIAEMNGSTVVMGSSQGDCSKEEKLLQRMIEFGVGGIILISSGKVSDYLQQLVKEKFFPLVFLDRDPGLSDINIVTVENREGMYQSAKYLITLEHRNILFLAGSLGASTTEDRYYGFMQAVSDSNLDKDKIIVRYADYNRNTAYNVVKDIFSDRNCPLTAICASNDEMAMGAIKALNDLNIKVPEEVSVIGYDDIPAARQAELTTVRQPLSEMGKNAMFQLLAAIRDRNVARQHITLSSNLILRNTGAPCRTIDKNL